MPTSNDSLPMAAQSNILLVDDDPGTIQLLGRILSTSGNLRFATSGAAALQVARDSVPDLMLLDAQMPGMDGFEVLKALKADPVLAEVPVIFVTSHRAPEFEVEGFRLGAVDFIVKPVVAPIVVARVSAQLRVKHMAEALRQISNVDALTGVANRRRFDDALETEWRRGRRARNPLSLLMVDVDHFKLYNDRYGHPAGDACLRRVADALSKVGVRPADLVARYGGEEFALVLPDTPRSGAERVAWHCLQSVGALAIAHDASPTAPCISVSIGIACYDVESACWVEHAESSPFADDATHRCTASDLVHAADKALYAAKQAGRARAMLLDIADADTPQVARAASPGARESTPPHG